MMAKEQLRSEGKRPGCHPPGKTGKLARLPKNARITKRPLLHAPISSALSGSNTQKVVYVSATSPFMSIVKRVRKYLAAIDKRSMGDIGASFLAATSDNERMSIAARGLSSSFAGINGSNGPRRSSNSAGDASSNDGKRGEEVLVKGTGRAIAKVLDVATYFMAQPDCRVVVRTGSVGTVDDIEILQSSSIENVEGDLAEDREEIMADADAAEATSKAQGSKMDGNDSDTEIPESRVRWTSVLELSIFLH